ncbi:MAG TPA: helix-turn-helix transcriptional regulator [Thermoanaerobaculia bacterium]|jgi:tetratricopeptide (TPR) repeat protein/DNA-binding XRE family transcriptional regulator|nr:helix-turn-helix transcriptional regulator [Thermoanaerobaculia bacterium]
MARQGDPADLRLVVSFLRSLSKWTQEELSKASGVDRGLISDYELGDKAPSRRTLERLASAVRLPYSHVEALLPMFRAARLAAEGGLNAVSQADAKVPESVADGLDRAILGAVIPRIQPHLLELEALVRGGEEVPVVQNRQQAAELWEALSKLSPKQRRAAVEAEPKYWTWAVAERLCLESVRAAAHRADRALELAKVALRVAELAPGSEPWRSRLKGYTWAFVGNARRVLGDLPGAEEAFVRSDCLWEAGAPADPGVLDGSRPLDLKASLRRHQGRYAESLALLDQALAVSQPSAAGRILLKKAFTLEQKGDYTRALEVLSEAEPLLDRRDDPRAPAILSFNRTVNLCHLGRYVEAQALVPGLRELALGLGNELDLMRALWLEGRVSAGLDRREEALPALEQVRRYFTREQIAYDAALASLEVAVLYLEAGRTGEVKALAEEMLWIFKAQGVHQEALAALKLFVEAARQENATVELARQVIADIAQARRSAPRMH